MAAGMDHANRIKLEDLLKRRFFYDQSFAIYGGISGLYDLGPMGSELEMNMISAWRNHFVLQEEMLVVKCTALTPEPVLKASGHVDRFIDWMVKDAQTGECFRADHLIKQQAEAKIGAKDTTAAVKAELEQILATLDGLGPSDMDAVIRKYEFKAPNTGNDLSEPVAFNLMFPTQIGPLSESKAYLRPETAQGIFVNFKRLLEFNQGRLPFAAAQIGSGFRNEISPRQGLIRVREFTMCEIEHFVDPEEKDHPEFSRVANLELMLFPACSQVDGKQPQKVSIGEAVKSGMVNNETLGYYMARTHLFLLSVGVDPQRLRFRQHMSNEMAHYAQDCWDAECLTSYSWIECVGNADRACYDLQSHQKATNARLVAEKRLKTPKQISIVEAVPNKGAIGKAHKHEAKQIFTALSAMSEDELLKMEKIVQDGLFKLDIGEGKSVELDKSLVGVKRYEKTVHVVDITPSVIEPSFGIGRIMYVVLEHSFRQREGDEKRQYLELPPNVAPIKCSVLPISANERLEPIVKAVREELVGRQLSTKIDCTSGSIGRRYARGDEIGIPFAVTVDFDSEKEPWSVTLRHMPSMTQVRMLVSEVGDVMSQLVSGRLQWADVYAKWPVFEVAAKDAEEKEQ